MLCKDAEIHDFEDPEPNQVEACSNLKEALVILQVLELLMVGRPYISETDSGAYQWDVFHCKKKDAYPTIWY